MENGKLKKAEKTRRQIENTFFELAMKTPGLLPNVSEICAEMDIYRSTFYNYYSSVDELVETVSREIAGEMERYYNGFSELGAPNPDNVWNMKNSVGSIVHFAKKKRRENIVLLNPELNLHYRRDIYDMIARGVRESLSDAPSGIRENTVVFMSEGVLAAIYRWLINQDMTVGDFSRFLARAEHALVDPFL